MSPSAPSAHAILVSHTHWDRAWYVPFQEFRVRLVRLVDRLIHLLETTPQFTSFMLDGQLSLVEDYLEVRPTMRRRLEALVRQGRITVGPWYTLPDEFLSSPEALIRNLQLGHRLGEELGGVLKVGYVPDGFGHMAQLPQLLRGFGIDSAFFWRGMGQEADSLGTHFRWASPDGSWVRAVWMPFGYHNVSNLGYPIHWGDTSQMRFSMDLAIRQIHNALKALEPHSRTPLFLLMNGIDHAEADPRIPAVVAEANRRLEGVCLRQGTLLDYLALLEGTALPTYSGELRWGRYSEILQGVYATRIPLKLANHRVETLLERYAEPLTALAGLAGACLQEGAADLLWTAWRYVLQSHAHDDIYGAGVDQTHRETLFRFQQAEQIARVVARDALRALSALADCTPVEGLPLLVYNPLNVAREELCVGEIPFDADDPTAHDFELVDEAGAAVPFQVLERRDTLTMEVLKANRHHVVKVAFPARVGPCGFALYGARPSRGRSAQALIRTWRHGAQNEWVRVEVMEDGSLEITHTPSGWVLRGLHRFEDREDIGDEYTSCGFTPPQVVAAQCRGVDVVAEGPVAVTFRASFLLQVPESLSPDRRSRSQALVCLPVDSDITVAHGLPWVEICTRVDNRARDHLLSAVFHVPLDVARVHVDEGFLVVPRSLDLPVATGWVEQPTALMHQRRFVDVSDGHRGVAILNRGLAAVEATRERGGVCVRLPLVRAVGWLSRADLPTRRVAAGPLVETPEAQCPGVHVAEYAILVHQGDWRQVYWPAYRFAAPLALWRADTTEGLDLRHMNITGDSAEGFMIPWPRGGPNPARVSFLSLEPSCLVLSSLTPSPGGVVVRFWNVEDAPVEGKLECWRRLSKAWRTDLLGGRLEELAVHHGHRVRVPVGAHQVVTLRLEVEGP